MSDIVLTCPWCGAALTVFGLTGREWLICSSDDCTYVDPAPAAHEVARQGGERLPGIDS